MEPYPVVPLWEKIKPKRLANVHPWWGRRAHVNLAGGLQTSGIQRASLQLDNYYYFIVNLSPPLPPKWPYDHYASALEMWGAQLLFSPVSVERNGLNAPSTDTRFRKDIIITQQQQCLAPVGGRACRLSTLRRCRWEENFLCSFKFLPVLRDTLLEQWLTLLNMSID
jgi:hypothetical protein